MLYGSLKNNNNITNYIGKTEDTYLLNKIFHENKNIDTVIHLSGVSNDPSAILSKEFTRSSNINSTKKLIDYCNKYKVKKFFFASSCSVYGFTGNKKYVNEESKVKPLSEYASSKIISEKIIFKYAKPELCVTSFRKATLFGYSPRMRFDLVVNTMVGSAYEKKKIILNGGNQWRPFLHVSDAADIYRKFIELNPNSINRKIFNIGNTNFNYQIISIAKMISKFTRCKIKKSTTNDTRSYKVNFDKLNKILNIVPQKDILYGVNQVHKALVTKKIQNFRDIKYYNIKRLLSFLNIEE
jgi:nucleoside-diphosphate-sugar epimerase